MSESTNTTNFTNWKRKTTFFLFGQGISMFGSSLVAFAIMWYIARTTNSGTMITLSTVCSFLPQIFISLFAGVWADRYNRKLLIILSDSLIAVSTLILALVMMSGYTKLWLIFAVSAIRSIGGGIQSPAVSALIPQIVPEEKLMRVNGINGTIQSTINLVSPAIGGAILTYGAIHNLMLIDVFTAIIGVLILAFIKIPIHKKALEKVKTDYFFDLKEGLKYSLEHSFIKQLLIFYALFTILIVPAAFLNVLMVTRVFGESYIYLTLNEVSFFIVSMVGGILISTWGGYKNRLKTLILGLFIFGICTFLIGFIKIFPIYLIIMLITGSSMPMFNSPIMVLLQEKVDTDMQGRVFSLLNITFTATMLIGMMGYGPLADIIPIEWLMISSGFLLLIFSFIVLKNTGFMKEGVPTPTNLEPCE